MEALCGYSALLLSHSFHRDGTQCHAGCLRQARDRVVTLPEGVRHFYLANATRCGYTMLRTTADKKAHIVVRNCKGEITAELDQCLSQTVLCINTPVAGLVEITVEE